MKIVTKKIAAVICVSVLSACATQQPLATSSVPDRGEINIYKNDKKEIESIIGNDALRAFKAEYAAASDNKAFAQSVSGSWNWKSNRTSESHAITSALIGCQRNNKRSEVLYPCKVINVNDEWVE